MLLTERFVWTPFASPSTTSVLCIESSLCLFSHAKCIVAVDFVHSERETSKPLFSIRSSVDGVANMARCDKVCITCQVVQDELPQVRAECAPVRAMRMPRLVVLGGAKLGPCTHSACATEQNGPHVSRHIHYVLWANRTDSR
jgi:hypothetical protein